MKYANLVIALVAIVLSVVALALSCRQYAKQTDQRKRDIILNAVGSLNRFCHVYEVMKHEREKTGSELEDHEQSLFSMFDFLSNNAESIIKTMKEMLNLEKITLSQDAIAQLQILQQSYDSLSIWSDFRYARFKSFNDNRINELKTVIKKVESIINNLRVI